MMCHREFCNALDGWQEAQLWKEKQEWKRTSKLFGITSAIIMQNTPKNGTNKAKKAITGIWEDSEKEDVKPAYSLKPEQVKKDEAEAMRIAKKLK